MGIKWSSHDTQLKLVGGSSRNFEIEDVQMGKPFCLLSVYC